MWNHCQCGERVTFYLTKLLKLIIDDRWWSQWRGHPWFIYLWDHISTEHLRHVSADEMLLMSDCHLFHGSLLGRSGELKRWNKRKIWSFPDGVARRRRAPAERFSVSDIYWRQPAALTLLRRLCAEMSAVSWNVRRAEPSFFFFCTFVLSDFNL